MREISVKFLLTDEQERRLKDITEGYKKLGCHLSEEKIFEMLMCTGCRYDIDNKLKFHECKLGLEERSQEDGTSRKENI